VKYNPTVDEIKYLYNFPNLKIKNPKTNLFAAISSPQNLQKLKFKSFYDFNSLKKVHLEDIILKNINLRTLCRSKSQHTIQELVIKRCGKYLSNNGFRDVVLLSNLKKLTIEYLGITDDAFIYYSLTKLESLSVSGCHNLTDRCFEAVGSLLKLKKLAIKNLEITDAAFFYLTQTKLESLSVSNCEHLTGFCFNGIQPYSLKKLKISWCEEISLDRFLNLVHLEIDGWFLETRRVLNITHLTKLEYAQLESFDMNKINIYLPSRLKKLNLTSCDNIFELHRYNNFAEFELDTLYVDSYIFDNNAIIQFKNVIHLFLKNTIYVTNSSIDKLDKLTTLTVKNCENIKIDRLHKRIYVKEKNNNSLAYKYYCLFMILAYNFGLLVETMFIILTTNFGSLIKNLI